jgi:hypothetical protein
MKRLFSLFTAAVVITLTAGNFCAAQSQAQQSQSLGDIARAAKKTKNAPAASKVYDNDNIPKTTSISVVGDEKSDTASDEKKADQNQDPTKNPDGTAKKDEQTGDKKPDVQLKAGQSAEERQKGLDQWKDKLAGQKDKISLLSRELDVLQREHQLKAAEFYSDTGRRTQNPNGFSEEDAKYKQQIADKQKQVDDAKGKLSDMEDKARKAGAPNSITE